MSTLKPYSCHSDHKAFLKLGKPCSVKTTSYVTLLPLFPNLDHSDIFRHREPIVFVRLTFQKGIGEEWGRLQRSLGCRSFSLNVDIRSQRKKNDPCGPPCPRADRGLWFGGSLIDPLVFLTSDASASGAVWSQLGFRRGQNPSLRTLGMLSCLPRAILESKQTVTTRLKWGRKSLSVLLLFVYSAQLYQREMPSLFIC